MGVKRGMVSCKIAILLLHYYCNNPLLPFSEKIINNRFMKPHTYRISEIKDTIGSHVFHWSAISLIVILPVIVPFVAYCEDGKKISSHISLGKLNISFGNLELAVLMVFLLAYLFYLVFRWSQRNEQASYLGVVYQETVFEFEFNRRRVRVDKKLHEEEYRRQALFQDDQLKNNRDKKPPSLPQQLLKYPVITRSAGYGGLGTPLPGLEFRRDTDGIIRRGGSRNPWEYSDCYELDTTDMDAADRSLYDKYHMDCGNYINEIAKWRQRLDSLEVELYNKELDDVRKKSEKAAKRAADVDISIFRGRGPTFVLEFTAIVVIIFSAVILGIIGLLQAEQIGTLLAAVAGYVLGRSTSRGSDGEQSAKTESEPSNNHPGDTAKESKDSPQDK